MRTKTLLLTAVLSAAGIASSLAQAVYSVNVVGYINLTLSPGLNLITVQLKGTNQNVNTLLGSTTPTMPDNSLLYTWDAAGQKYNVALIGAGGVWYDAVGPSTMTLSPGQAFFIKVDGTAPVTLTLVGEVPAFPVPVSVANGLGFYGDPAPVSQVIATNGFPIVDNDALYTWNTSGQKWNDALIGAGGQWFNTVGPVDFAPAVGQGFAVLHAGGAATWNRTFTIQ